jgi:hypothetical protein
MAEIPAASVSRRPPLAFRVGVTGARALAPEIADRLRPAVAEILGLVARQMAKLADDPLAKPVYSTDPAGAAPFTLRLLSPLAEGSDRLVAEQALKAGYRLYAPLPFVQHEYENDFKESVGAFRALLAQAEVLELDGGRAVENESYREVGRFVVRNCDLLIAIWDGEREKGVGGTAEIVRFAVGAGVPVWWIDANGANPSKLVDEPLKLHKPSSAPTGEDAAKGVELYLDRTVLPPHLADPEHSGIFGFIAHQFSRHRAREESPLADYLRERKLASSFLWHAYSWLMELVAPKSEQPAPGHTPAPVHREQSHVERWWDGLYEPANEFSIGYGDRYRSSYVLIAILAFLAIAAPAFGSLPWYGLELFVDALEMLALAGIAALVLANHIYRWHERWISYRLLAELCRKQCVLSAIGRSLPVSEVIRMSLDAIEEKEGEEVAPRKLPREAWVAWYFTAAVRAAPFLVGTLSAANAGALAMARALTDEQTAYHRGRRDRNKAAGRGIGQFGEIFFLLAVGFAGLKLLLIFRGQTIGWSTTLVACLSAASGAFVGIRAYSEFPLLVQQSTHMLHIMKETRTQLDAIELDQPLASRDLGRIMQELAISMMQDVSGWMQLFRIKALEAA